MDNREFARQHPELRFLVTRIGCGIAGFKSEEIAPLFADALEMENVTLPEAFAFCAPCANAEMNKGGKM